MAWSTNFAPLSIGFGFLALCFQILLTSIPGVGVSRRFHDTACLLWICGNFIWMISDIAFDPEMIDCQVNLSGAPFIRSDPFVTSHLQLAAMFSFSSALLFVGLFYMGCFYQYRLEYQVIMPIDKFSN